MKKILLVISIISVLLLAGCNKNETYDESNLLENMNNQQQEVDLKNLEEEIGKEDSEQVVQDLISELKYGEYVRIPYINLESEDVKKVNQEIDNLAKEEIQTWGEMAHRIDYKYNQIDNILSVFISQDTESGNITNYYAYNFDISSGKLLKNSEVIGEEKSKILMSELSDIYAKEFEKHYPSMIEKGDFGSSASVQDKEQYEEYLEYTKKNNVPTDVESITYYIDEEFGPQIVTKLEIAAGAGVTYVITNLSDYIQ